MSITHVSHEASGTYGAYVRVYVAQGHPKLCSFLAYRKYGGRREVTALARIVEAELKAQAREIRARLASATAEG